MEIRLRAHVFAGCMRSTGNAYLLPGLVIVAGYNVMKNILGAYYL